MERSRIYVVCARNGIPGLSQRYRKYQEKSYWGVKAGCSTSSTHTAMRSSRSSMAGYATACAIVSGNNGRNPRSEGEVLSDWGFHLGKHIACSRSRMGGWAIACSPMMRTTITIDRLKQGGYLPFVDYYLSIRVV